MTDNEMAEEYEEKTECIEVNDDGKKIYDSIDIQQAYLTGLKTGRKEKWHDLRNNPKDLPNGYRAVLNQEGKTTIYDPSRGFLGLDGVEVIAWCEIPKYLAEFDYSEWHYIKDGVLPNVKFGRVDVTVAYINAYENPCKMDCCFNGSNFVYWDFKSSVGWSWKNADIFGKIYAWKYPEKLPEPPEENEE